MVKNDIRQVRLAEGLSVRSLASRADIPYPALSEIERYERRLHRNQRQRIEEVLGPVRVWLEIEIPRGEA